MAECVKVIVRCRPMNEREKGLNCKCVINMEPARGSCSINNPADAKAPPKLFTFDGAYFIDSTTEQIYNEIAYPLVEGVTEGYNGTIFAYGQTGCGKSFCMQGITDPPTQRGIIPRSFDHIFETVGVAEGCKFLIHASYLEIYNEEIRDLLGKDAKAKMDLKEHPEKGVYVAGLSMHPVHNVTDCERIMNHGWKNRAVGATLMNADSSRSHSIFTIMMEMITVDDNGEEHIRVGKLNLVDLAGSERQAKTGATGDRLKEATKINLSLSALGNVISALVDGKSTHIPYRDSKLTRLLQDSLGGNTKTMMVACLSPADNNYDESLSTLRYANRAKNIKNKPKINEDPKDALLREYQEEIAKLKAMLQGQIPLPAGGFDSQSEKSLPSGDHHRHSATEITRQELEKEKEHLRMEYEQQMEEMKRAYEEERTNKDKLQQDMDKLRAFYDTKLRSVDGQIADLPSTAADVDKIKASHMLNKKTQKPATAAVPATGTDGGEGEIMPPPISLDESMLEGPEIADISQPLIQGPDGMIHVQKETSDMEILTQEETPAVHFSKAPKDTSTNNQISDVTLQQEEALKRLQALQQRMVGGENIDNKEVKERHKRRKMYAEDQRKKQLIRANKKMDDDGIMVSIYDEVTSELKVTKESMLEKQKEIESLEREIIDLQTEFEFDRIDYLDTIRKQERHIKLLDAIIDRIQPCLRRDSNYYNLDRIRTECKWNEDEQRWILPKMTVEKTALPAAGTVLPGGRNIDGRMRVSPSTNGDRNCSPVPDDDFSDERQKERFRRTEDMSNSYFQAKRQNQLINSSEPLNKFNIKEVKDSLGSSNLNYINGLQDNVSKELRAAQVHGQVMNDDVIRRPVRLGALPAVGVMGKKPKKKKGGLDPF